MEIEREFQRTKVKVGFMYAKVRLRPTHITCTDWQIEKYESIKAGVLEERLCCYLNNFARYSLIYELSSAALSSTTLTLNHRVMFNN